MDKKSLDKYFYCLPYLPIQKVWTFFNWSLSLNVYFLTFVRILLVNNHARYHQGHFKWRIFLWMTWNIKKSLPNHMKKIPTITIFEILHTFIGMDINIWSTYPENYVQTFVVFSWDPSLREGKLSNMVKLAKDTKFKEVHKNVLKNALKMSPQFCQGGAWSQVNNRPMWLWGEVQWAKMKEHSMLIK